VEKAEILGKSGKYSPMVLFFAEKLLHVVAQRILSRMSTHYQ